MAIRQCQPTADARRRRSRSRIWSGLCLVCGLRRSALGICSGCRPSLPWKEPGCPQCAASVPSSGACAECLVGSSPVDHTFAVFDFDFPVDDLIRFCKYRHRADICTVLGAFLGRHLTSVRDPVWTRLVPVPMHPDRERIRGYNHATAIASAVAGYIGGDVDTGLVRRARNSPEQAAMPSRARRANVAGAFQAVARCDGERVLVIDDVATTGSTAQAVARALATAGAASIDVACVARAGS